MKPFDNSGGASFAVRKGKDGSDQPWCQSCISWSQKGIRLQTTLRSCGQLTVTVPKSERICAEAQNSAAAPAVSSGAAVRLTSGVASTPSVPSMGANVAAYAADPSAAQLDHAHEYV